MTLGDTRIIDYILCRFLKKGSVAPSTARPVKVTITPGKITITSLEDKFDPFTLKTTDFVHPPKAPTRNTTVWVSLDCVQHVNAKYTYINFMIDRSKMADIIETLMFAWSFNKINDPNSSGIFADNGNTMMMNVHKPPPKAVVTPGIRDVQPKNEFDFAKDDEDHNVFPTPQKSLTSLSASSTFYRAFKKPSNTSSIFNNPHNYSTNSVCLPPVTKKTKLSDAMEAVKEYKEIEKEFVLLAEKVFRLEKKGREDVMNLMKGIVEDALKSEK